MENDAKPEAGTIAEAAATHTRGTFSPIGPTVEVSG